MDQIENGNMQGLDFIELNACPGGCVGGVMTVENPFIAKARIRSLRRYLPISQNAPQRGEDYIPADYFFEEMPSYTPMTRLSENLGESMRLMARMEEVHRALPGIDCGACGAPNCRAFAEDVVRGQAQLYDCVVSMRKTIRDYASQMHLTPQNEAADTEVNDS